MLLEFGDWRFFVDTEATRARTTRYSFEHCECGYCKNFYEAVDVAYPQLREALGKFGIHPEGPCELMPFEPTLMLACYRVDGRIEQWGKSQLFAAGVPLVPEAGDEETFLLWVGEMQIPWLQKEAVGDVVSPANLPEFLARMKEVWTLRHGDEYLFS